MRSVLATLTALLPAVAGSFGPAPIETAVVFAFQAAGRPAPSSDRTLSAAARILARAVLADGPSAGTDADAVTRAVSDAGGWDPYPRTLVVRTRPADHAARALASREDLAAAPATHFGVGTFDDGESGAAVLLLVERRADLDPFPRKVAPGSSHLLGGRLSFPYFGARVFVKGPRGVVEPAALPGAGPEGFGADLGFGGAGPHTVEVVAESIKGPEVVVLFRVDAGRPGPAPHAARPVPERADLEKAKGQVLEAINRTRRAHGAAPLRRLPLLDALAADHAAEMVRLGYFAHVSPVSGDLAQRARRAGLRYQRVTENLGEAPTALAAHRLIEASPGHLVNVIDPGVDLVGIGATRVSRGAVENVLLVEVFARPRP